jgi:putative addiction module killer protein
VEARERAVQYYLDRSTGIAPFREWFVGITDKRAKAAIDARIARFRGGNFGDSGPIGEGASENTIDFGPGYRIYYGVDGDRVIVLWGGDKSSQSSDIERAKAFWRDYKAQKKNEQKRRLQGRPARKASK